jgi:hypothetical protein
MIDGGKLSDGRGDDSGFGPLPDPKTMDTDDLVRLLPLLEDYLREVSRVIRERRAAGD